jgi:uncharacterized surface protein with fasciclin (FAS1) repeats
MKISKLSRGLGVAMLTGMLGATALVAPVAAEQEENSSSKKTIYKIAKSSDDFDTLTAAVNAAGLKKVLKGKDALTVFAPTDDAFEQVDPAVLEALLADKEALTDLLTYHVAEGKVLSSDLEDGQVVESLSGEEFTIYLSDEGATIEDGGGNTTNITATDIKAKNGVIHVIDAVLTPAS